MTGNSGAFAVSLRSLILPARVAVEVAARQPTMTPTSRATATTPRIHQRRTAGGRDTAISGGADSSDAPLTGARKRYPRRATVSTNLGFSAESPSASRSLLTAVLMLCSKSTKVSSGHNRPRSSSRVTTSPGRSNNVRRICKGWSCSLTLTPLRRSSPVFRSTANTPKRRVSGTPAGRLLASDMPCSLALADPHMDRYLARYLFDVTPLISLPRFNRRVTRPPLRYVPPEPKVRPNAEGGRGYGVQSKNLGSMVDGGMVFARTGWGAQEGQSTGHCLCER